MSFDINFALGMILVLSFATGMDLALTRTGDHVRYLVGAFGWLWLAIGAVMVNWSTGNWEILAALVTLLVLLAYSARHNLPETVVALTIISLIAVPVLYLGITGHWWFLIGAVALPASGPLLTHYIDRRSSAPSATYTKVS